MTYYSIERRNRIYVKDYTFFSLAHKTAKKIANKITKNWKNSQ